LLEKIAKLEEIPAAAADRATLGQELFLENQT